MLLRCVLSLALAALWEPAEAQTKAPSYRPSRTPSVTKPSKAPRTSRPSKSPTLKPTKKPTKQPTSQPTKLGQASPTVKPTRLPTLNPTRKPTRQPTTRPSKSPASSRPSRNPTSKPTRKPTRAPTKHPNTCIPVETCTPLSAHCACDGTCKTTYKDCNSNLDDGCEVDSARDINNCGECENQCTTGLYQMQTSCNLGTCKYTCLNQFQGDCDNNIDNGCETAIFTNEDCGACGVQCSAPQSCMFDNVMFKYRCMTTPPPEPYY